MRFAPLALGIGLKVRRRNAARDAVPARVEFRVAPASGGETLVAHQVDRVLSPGDTTVETELVVEGHRLWELRDPFLYRVTARSTPRKHTLRACSFPYTGLAPAASFSTRFGSARTSARIPWPSVC